MTTMPEYDLTAATWHKSSYSDGTGGDCVEVCDAHPDLVPVRDSKQPEGPHVVFRAQAWAEFVRTL